MWRHVENVEETTHALRREGIRRVLTDHRWRFLAPDGLRCWNQGVSWVMGGACRTIARQLHIDSGIGWRKPVEHACQDLTADDVDVILATGSPFTAFPLAKHLSERLGRPYVLDYRDPWTANPHAVRSPWSSTIRQEARLLAGCAAVTIVSHAWGLALDHRYGLGPKLHVITNGYDPEELGMVSPQRFGHFAIVYTGNFYPPKRVISPVMAALKHLTEARNAKRRTWYFHYYGEHTEHVRHEAERFGITDRLLVHGRVSRAEALSAVKGAGIGVVITSVFEHMTAEDQGIVPGKVFETLGLATPLLLIAPPGSEAEVIVQSTRIGHRFTGNDIEGMTSFLGHAIDGQVFRPQACEIYAWAHLADRLDGVLRKAIVSTNSSPSKVSP
jgi:glycosyltransferase involved in cell wall biosynthesis